MRISNIIIGIQPSNTGNGLDIDLFGVPSSLIKDLENSGLRSETIMGDTTIEFYTKVCIHQMRGSAGEVLHTTLEKVA